MAKREINLDLLDKVTAATLEDYIIDVDDPQELRVERLLLELVRPDPVQPRRVLPDRIYYAFHNNKLTPTQALREIVQSAQVAARQRGRPFSGLLDLLPNPDGDNEEESAPLSPEEQLLRELINLAVTIRDDGQVNPLTVVNVSEGVTQLYRIETGERRYWATWLLRDFLPGYTGDGMIPCIIIPGNVASTFRQAKENTARSGLSAIALARQAALLLLTVHGYEIPTHAVDNDFYRQALELDSRGHGSEILAAMGGISKVHFSRYKALLKLSDDALELADRHSLDEGTLRYVVAVPEEHHEEVIRQIIDFGLTGRQVKELCTQEGDGTREETRNHSKPSRQLAKLLRLASASSANDLAQMLLEQEKDIHVARARLQAMKKLLDDAERFLSER